MFLSLLEYMFDRSNKIIKASVILCDRLPSQGVSVHNISSDVLLLSAIPKSSPFEHFVLSCVFFFLAILYRDITLNTILFHIKNRILLYFKYITIKQIVSILLCHTMPNLLTIPTFYIGKAFTSIIT